MDWIYHVDMGGCGCGQSLTYHLSQRLEGERIGVFPVDKQIDQPFKFCYANRVKNLPLVYHWLSTPDISRLTSSISQDKILPTSKNALAPGVEPTERERLTFHTAKPSLDGFALFYSLLG